MTLIIYDDQGEVFSNITGNYLIPQGGVQFMEVEVPNGKRVASVDVSVTPHQVVLEDIPPTEIEQLRERQSLMQAALDDLILGGTL